MASIKIFLHLLLPPSLSLPPAGTTSCADGSRWKKKGISTRVKTASYRCSNVPMVAVPWEFPMAVVPWCLWVLQVHQYLVSDDKQENLDTCLVELQRNCCLLRFDASGFCRLRFSEQIQWGNVEPDGKFALAETTCSTCLATFTKLVIVPLRALN
jgi:hypothetical protein